MKGKKAAALLLSAVLLIVACLPVSAEQWNGGDFTVEVPEGMYRLDQSVSPDDPVWALVGVADVNAKLKEYKDMNVVADFVSKDGKLSVVLMKRESDVTKQVYNLSQQTPEEQQQTLEQVAPKPNPEAKPEDILDLESSLHQTDSLSYYRVRMSGKTAEMGEVDELIYGTIVNGYALNFDTHVVGGALPAEAEELLAGMMSSLKINNILEKPVTTPMDMGLAIALLVLMVLVIAAPFIYMPIRNKIDKRNKAKLAQQLTDYRKLHGDTVSGDMRFANSTDCTREAIHKFAYFHSYIKNLPALLLGALLSLVAVAVSFALDADWWMKLLSVGVVVYFGYKAFTTPTNTEKVQRKVFERGTSTTAVYAFYEEAFRVSGVQSASVYPYFQLTDVRKHGQYVYLYYGPDNAFLVDQYGFASGSYEDFLKFISEKTGKKV